MMGLILASTILEDLFGGLWDDYFNWYADRIFEGASLQNIGQLIVAVIVIYVILMLLSAVFPFIGRILNMVFIPFTIAHVWMHVREMKLIKRTHDVTEFGGPHYGSHSMGSSLTLAILQNEWSSARMVTDNPRSARRVAYAPLKLFLPLFALVIVSSPLLSLLIVNRTISILVHMYLLLGCLCKGFPTTEDHYFYYYAIMMHSSFSPWYIIYAFPLFVFLTTVSLGMGQDPFNAIVNGITYSFVYMMLFFVLAARYATWYEAERPDIAYWEGLNPFEANEMEPSDRILMLGFDDGHVE
jgi:hypothetical protein